MRRALEGQDNPIEILLSIAADEAVAVDTRVVAAAHAAPYMFPKLSASVVQQNHTVTKVDATTLRDRLDAEFDRIARLAAPSAIVTDRVTMEVEGEVVESPDQAGA